MKKGNSNRQSSWMRLTGFLIFSLRPVFFCLKVFGFLRISDKMVSDGFGWYSCISCSSAKFSLRERIRFYSRNQMAKSGEIDCEVYYHSEHIRSSLQIINYCRFHSDPFIYSRKWSSFIASAFSQTLLNFIVERNSRTIKKINRCRYTKMLWLNITNRICAGAPGLCVP